MKVFSHKPYCFVYCPPETDYWCEVEVKFYCFPYKYPVDPELFIEGFPPGLCSSTSVNCICAMSPLDFCIPLLNLSTLVPVKQFFIYCWLIIGRHIC